MTRKPETGRVRTDYFRFGDHPPTATRQVHTGIRVCMFVIEDECVEKALKLLRTTHDCLRISRAEIRLMRESLKATQEKILQTEKIIRRSDEAIENFTTFSQLGFISGQKSVS